MTNETIKVIEKKIGYTFNEKYLLIQAFTRSSFAEENQNWESNEKLEFVGDKVLDLVIVKKITQLFSYPETTIVQTLSSIKNGERKSAENLEEKGTYEFAYSEGEMTEIKKQIVQTSFLSNAIEQLALEEHLLMSKGDIINNVQKQPHVKEDLCEAIIGAVAIDSSWDFNCIERVVEKLLNLNYVLKNGIEDGIDYVSYVNNWHQKEFGREPEYFFYDHEHDSSEEIFQCSINFPGMPKWFFGFGHSKKLAIRMAAKRVYEHVAKLKERQNRILDIIGDFNYDNAINKLELLKEKKIITGLDYAFTEGSVDPETGNPTWYCRCVVDGVKNYVEWGDSSKKEAKKNAAFVMLNILINGRDRFTDLVDETKIIEITEVNDD